MPISEGTKTALEGLKEKITEWRDARITELNDEASFLKSLDMSLSAVAKTGSEEATAEAVSLIEELIGSTTEEPDEEEVK